MKKQVKGIVGLGAVLVVLGGGLAALKLTGSDDSKNENSSPIAELPAGASGAGVILVQDSDELPGTEEKLNADGTAVEPQKGVVEKIHVKNEETEFDLIVTEKATEDSAAKYSIKGYEDLDVDSAMLSTLAYNINGVTSASLIEENCQNLEKFGLADPAVSGEMTFESGRTKKYYVGIKNPADTSKSYFRVEGSNNVYTIENSRIANYSKTPKDFINKLMLEEPSQEEMPIVNSVVVERKDIDYNVVLKYNERLTDGKSGGSSAVHEMVEPVKCFLAVENSSDITNGMFGLRADDIYAMHCTEKDLSETGLDDPFCRVTMSCDDGNEYVLLISDIIRDEGEKEDASDDTTFCYIMFEGGKVIYTISPDKAKWVNFMPVDIASRIMIGSYVWNIDELSISCNTGDKADFVITPLDSTIDRYGTKADDYTVTKNGKEFDAERYRKLVSYLININGESFAFDEPEPDGEPMVTLKIKEGYTKEDHTYEFYDHSVMNVLIVVDGKSKFFGSKSNVKTLIENVKKLDTGEDFVTTWS